MSIKATFEPENADKIEMTLHITMPLGDWRLVRKQLEDHPEYWHPSSQVRRAIDDLVRAGNKSFDFYAADEPEVEE